mgnify:CR=1 FL=1|tara:strand:+ start:139343 stop:140458 length:1116 start_codon:yes stop_codon:yes gene_type:complete
MISGREIRQPLTQIPVELAAVSDYERLAPQFMAPDIHAYIAGGCGSEITLRKNTEHFENINLAPHVLQDFSSASTQSSLLGRKLNHPILLGPVAHQCLVHPEGELATVAGAEVVHAMFIASTLSHVTLEAVAESSGNDKWFQLYFQATREVTLSLVKRAEAAGYQALVITVDVPVTGMRYRAQRAGFTMPSALVDANLVGYTVPPPRVLERDQSVVFDGLMSDAPTWNDIEWLLESTSLPVILKGIIRPDDALRAQAMGVAAVVVSNHGGRSLDGLPATIDALPRIRQQLGADYPVLFDSGIRSGGDVFKAIALGANAVLIGRPQVYALAVAGALGVAHMLRILHTELEVTMALAGCPSLDTINSETCFTI